MRAVAGSVRRVLTALGAAGALAVPGLSGQEITLRADGGALGAVAPSANFSLPVHVDLTQLGGENLASISFDVTWDPSRVTYSAATAGTFGQVVINESGTAAGRLSVGLSNPTGTTTSFDAVTIDFAAGATEGLTSILPTVVAAGNEAGTNIVALVRSEAFNLCISAGAGLWGDANGDGTVNIIDAQQIARFSVGLSVANPALVLALGDVNADGQVNIIDAQQVARFSVGLSASPRIGTAAPGSCTNQAPTAQINAPASGGGIPLGSPIQFDGEGEDPEDGTLSGASLEWISSRDGVIGTGTSFSTSSLSGGAHVITLVAKDSEGAIGISQITIGIEGNPPGVCLTNGDNHPGTIAAAGEVDVCSFVAAAGDYVAITMAEVGSVSAFMPFVRVLSPTGVQWQHFSQTTATVRFQAPESGTYSVSLSDGSAAGTQTASYVARLAQAPEAFVVPAGDEGGPLTNGQNHTGTIELGDMDMWSFTAAVGEQIALTMAEEDPLTGFQPWMRVVSPSGVLSQHFSQTVASLTFQAAESGTYTVIAADGSSGTAQTSDYTIRLARAPGAFVVPAGDEGGDLTVGENHSGTVDRGDMDMWTFAATTGEQIALTMAEEDPLTSFQPWIRVVSPSGVLSQHFSQTVASVRFQATETGTYTVIVSDASSGRALTSDYTLRLARAPGAFVVPAGDDGGVMTNGQNHAGFVDRGDMDIWSFDATTGEQVALTMAEEDPLTSFQPWIRVISPSGALSQHFSQTVASLRFQATETGTYTVIVSDASSGTAQTSDYTLRLAKAPGAFVVPEDGGALTSGENHPGTIDRGDMDMWSFDAGVGDQIALTMAEEGALTSFQPWIRVISPSGVLSQHFSQTVASVTFQATEAGTYTVITLDASSGSALTGDYTLRLVRAPGASVVPVGDEGGGLAIGATAGTIDLGDMDVFTIDAVVGAQISLTMSEEDPQTSFQPWIRVVSPSGVLSQHFSQITASLSFQATETGTYTVLLSDASSGRAQTSDYTVTFSRTN